MFCRILKKDENKLKPSSKGLSNLPKRIISSRIMKKKNIFSRQRLLLKRIKPKNKASRPRRENKEYHTFKIKF